MDRSPERHLEILTVIGEGDSLTQRALAQRLGVAVGLTNLYLKRLARKGYIKIVEFPKKPKARRRLRYLLTPRGLAEKTRLTYHYMDRSLGLCRRARVALRDALTHLPQDGAKRIALHGAGEAAELAYLTLREYGLEPVGIFAPEPGGVFLGVGVRGERELAHEEIDRIIVATFDKPKLHVQRLLDRKSG